MTLDVNRLSELGGLRPDCSGACQWSNGNDDVFSINLHAEAERLHLSYSVRGGGGEWEDVAEIVPLVHLRCRFGGSRPYFICPGPDGNDCGRRITKLYLSRRYFLCRHCNQLAYASQYEEPWQRARRRANKLKQRLGVDAGILPEKTKRMRRRTFDGLLNEMLQAEILANEAEANMFRGLLTQLKK